ncbi:MAG TPA: hypothetical protein PK728_12975 [Bacillota bacterium]|nr:hypothetical protein [Bacillota bacterium]
MDRHFSPARNVNLIKIIGENITKMNFLQNLVHGNLAIHQELVNKFIKETVAGHKTVKNIEVSITGGLIYLDAGLSAGNIPVRVKLVLSLSGYEFDRHKRVLEFTLQEPVTVSIDGIHIKARLEAAREENAESPAGAPEGLLNLLEYLDIKEDKITLDLNKMPGFNQLLQNRLGFIFRNLEITSLEVLEEMIIIHPSLKFF